MTAADAIVVFVCAVALIGAPLWVIALGVKSGAEALETMAEGDEAANAIGFTADQEDDEEEDE